MVDGGIFLTAPASFISAGESNEIILSYLGDIMLNIQSLIKFPIPLNANVNINASDDEIDKDIFASYEFTKDEIIYINSQI